MNLLHFFADVFIDTFGITRPAPAMRRTVTLFLGGMMLLVIACVAAAGFVLLRALR